MRFYLIRLTLAFLLCLSSFAHGFDAVAAETELFFTPDKAAAQAVKSAIDSAQSTIHIQASAVTHKAIQQGLVDAAERGVETLLILDQAAHQGGEYTNADFFSDWNIKTYLYLDGTLRDYWVLIDSTIALTGTFNFSGATERDLATHLFIIKDNPELILQIFDNFSDRLSKCRHLPPKRRRALADTEQLISSENVAESPQKEQPQVVAKEKITFIGNTKSLVFHKSSCTSGKKLKAGNRIDKKNREYFIEQGYKPCGRCKP